MIGRAPRLTAALITLNEQPRLLKLLPRLDWVDEIVVVDSGSTDGTVELALHYGCRVISHPLDHFAAQRNRALDLATGDWVLSIDADELPAPGFATTVRSLINETCAAAGRVPIRSTIFGQPFRYCGTQDDIPVRLFRRKQARWSGAVHERLEVAGDTVQLPIGLEHHTIPNLASFMAKMNRYTQLEVNARLASGEVPRKRDLAIAPLREIFRRLVWKRGVLDGPAGWAFCCLSGLSAWVVADKHRRQWHQQSAHRGSTTASPVALVTPSSGYTIQTEALPCR